MKDAGRPNRRCRCEKWRPQSHDRTQIPGQRRIARRSAWNAETAEELLPAGRWWRYQCLSAFGAGGSPVPTLRRRRLRISADEVSRQLAAPLFSSGLGIPIALIKCRPGWSFTPVSPEIYSGCPPETFSGKACDILQRIFCLPVCGSSAPSEHRKDRRWEISWPA